MNYDFIKLCPLCRRPYDLDEFATISAGTTKPICSNDKKLYFDEKLHINCCKICGEILKNVIDDEIASIHKMSLVSDKGE